MSVRCRYRVLSKGANRTGDAGASWLGGRIIGRDVNPGASRYVVQLDDDRRVVADAAEVRRWSLAFELYETLEKMAS